MGNKVSIDGMASAVMDELERYGGIVADDMKKAVRGAGNTAKKEIARNAPKDTGAYAKSWAVKTTKDTSTALEVTVHSKNRYQLAHLLEHGHAKRNGGRVAARPHIAAAEEAAARQLEEDIEGSLKNG